MMRALKKKIDRALMTDTAEQSDQTFDERDMEKRSSFRNTTNVTGLDGSRFVILHKNMV